MTDLRSHHDELVAIISASDGSGISSLLADSLPPESVSLVPPSPIGTPFNRVESPAMCEDPPPQHPNPVSAISEQIDAHQSDALPFAPTTAGLHDAPVAALAPERQHSMAGNLRTGDTETATQPDDGNNPKPIQANYAQPSPLCSTNSNTPVISVPYGNWLAEHPLPPGDAEVVAVQSAFLPLSEPAAEEAAPTDMDTDLAIPGRSI